MPAVPGSGGAGGTSGGGFSSGGIAGISTGGNAPGEKGSSGGSAAMDAGGDPKPDGGTAPTDDRDFDAGHEIDAGPAVGLGTAFPTVGTNGGSATVAAPGQLKIAYRGKFMELPVGAVKAQGWLKGWLKRQDSGMTGHPEKLGYPFNSGMYAVGKIPDPPRAQAHDWYRYEQSGYFVDAVTRLSGVIDTPSIDTPNSLAIVNPNMSYIVDHAGPAKLGESTLGWTNTVVGRSVMASYGLTSDVTRPAALRTCVLGSKSVADRDGDLAEEALYVYGLTADSNALAFAQKAYNAYYINDSSAFAHINKINGTGNFTVHGVTTAEQFKLLPMMYAYTGDTQALALAEKAYHKIETNSLMPDGGMVSSEFMGTTAFNSRHESCDLTDWSWSVGYLMMADGSAHWGDLIEQTIFNAVPGSVTKDFKQTQYFSSVNQIAATSNISPGLGAARMSYRAEHDTPCCTGNINRAIPNYVTRMWMGIPGGVAATLYGPSEVKVNINQQPVTITETTDYPFRDTVTLRVGTSRRITFALGLRIPEWCTGATVAVNGKAATLDTGAGTFATLTREFQDADTIVIRLPMAVKLQQWLGGKGVSVQRGPLVYALKIDETRTESAQGNNFPIVQFAPASEWRYGMVAAQRNAPQTFTVVESATMPDNPYDSASVPVKIQVPLHALPQWQSTWTASTASENPTALPTTQEQQNVGAAQTMTLVPYGSTYLRLTMLPALP